MILKFETECKKKAKLTNFFKDAAVRLGFTFLLCVCFFGNSIFLSFATDTYATFADLDDVKNIMMRVNGRVFIGLVYKLWILLGISNEVFYYISSITAIIMLFLSVYVMQYTLKKVIRNDFSRIGISFLSIVNAFLIEYFMFIEKSMFMVAIFFNILAYIYMLKYLKQKKIKYYFLTSVFLVCAVFTYQGTIALFVVLTLPFTFKYAKNLVDYVKNVLLVMVIFGFAGTLNVFVVREICKSYRVKENTDLFQNIVLSVKVIKDATVFTFDILPQYTFAVFFILILGISIICIAVGYQKMKIGLQLLNLFIIFVGTAVASTASITVGSGGGAPRVIYPYASIIGIYIINIYVNIFSDKTDYNTRFRKDISCVIGICIAVFLLFQYIAFSSIMKDKYVSNYVDQYRCLIIDEKIKAYEADTGMKVMSISFYRDKKEDIQYSDLFVSGDLVVSSFSTPWSDVAAINYYTKEEYLRGEPEKFYQDYFMKRDWKAFSEEQLIFDGNKLHLCVY